MWWPLQASPSQQCPLPRALLVHVRDMQSAAARGRRCAATPPCRSHIVQRRNMQRHVIPDTRRSRIGRVHWLQVGSVVANDRGRVRVCAVGRRGDDDGGMQGRESVRCMVQRAVAELCCGERRYITWSRRKRCCNSQDVK